MNQKVKRLRSKTATGSEPARKKIKLIYPYYLPPELWRMIVAYLTKVRDRVHVLLTNHTHHLPVQTGDLHEKMKRSAFDALIINYGMEPPIPSKDISHDPRNIFSKLYNTMGKPPDAAQAYCLYSAIVLRRDAMRHERYVQSRGKDGYDLWVVGSDVEKYTTPRKPTIINIVGDHQDASTRACLIICHGIHPKRIVMKWRTYDKPKDIFKEFAAYLKNLCLGLGMIFNPSDFKHHFRWSEKPILPLVPEEASFGCACCDSTGKVHEYRFK